MVSLTVKYSYGSFTTPTSLPLMFDTHLSFTDFDVYLFPSTFDAPFGSSMDAGWLLFMSERTRKE